MKREINKNLNLITFGSIVMDALFIILGMFLMTNPETSTQVAGILFGIILMVSGLYAIIKFVLNMNSAYIFTFELIYGILNIIAGFLIIGNPFSITNIITVMVGICFIVSAILKLSIALQFKRFNEETWLFNFIIALLTVILGVLLLVNPFSASIVLTTYAGIMIIIYAGMDIVEQLLFRKRANEIEKIIFK